MSDFFTFKSKVLSVEFGLSEEYTKGVEKYKEEKGYGN